MFNGYIFRYDYILWGSLICIPILGLLWLLYTRRRSALVKQYLGFISKDQLLYFFSFKKEVILICWILLEILFLMLAFARPQRLDKEEIVEKNAVDIVIALDISLSMLAEDLEPSRLDVAKTFAKKIIYYLEGNRFALVYFSGRSFVQSPLTLDYASLFSFLDSVQAGLIPDEGTALGSAIELSMERFVSTGDNNNTKVMLLLTDGEETKDSYQSAIKQADEKHIKIYTIGVASSGGGAIPVRGKTNEYMKDKNGEVYISKLNREILQQISFDTGGHSYLLSSNDFLDILESVLKNINEIPPYKVDGISSHQASEYFWFFLSIACVMMALRFIFLSSFNRFLKYFKNIKQSIFLFLFLFFIFGFFQNCSFYDKDIPRLFYSYRFYSHANKALEIQDEIKVTNQDSSIGGEEVNKKINTVIAYYQKIFKDPFLTSFIRSRLYLNLALLYTRVSKFEDANYYYLKALNIDDLDWQEKVLYNQGTNYLLWNKFSESIAVYTGVLKVNSSNYDAKYNLQVALYLKENSPEQENQDQDNEKEKNKDEQEGQPNDKGQNNKNDQDSNEFTEGDEQKGDKQKGDKQKGDKQKGDKQKGSEQKSQDSNQKEEKRELSEQELKEVEATRILDALQEREQEEYKRYLQKIQENKKQKNPRGGGARW